LRSRPWSNGSTSRDAFRRLHADELETLAEVAANIDRADLVTCAAVLERLTDALVERSRSGD
jgi:hypothetical protein